SQIFAITGQQIECEEARWVPTMKHQIFELWSATSVERANFSVNDGSCVRQCSRDLLSKFRERSERMPRCVKATEHGPAQRWRVLGSWKDIVLIRIAGSL